MLLQTKDEEEKLILSTVDQLMKKYDEKYWLDKDQKRDFQ